jgi:hypothetical protein
VPGTSWRIAAGWKTLPATQKSLRRLFLEKAFCIGFRLALQIAESGVDVFGNVLPGGFLPVRFSDFEESLANFSAPTWGVGNEELIRKEQGRSRMGPATPAVTFELFSK